MKLMSANIVKRCLMIFLLAALGSPSSAQTRVYVSEINSNAVSVIDTSTNTVVASIPVGVNPIAVAITPDGTRVYVTNESSNSVSVIDTLTNSVAATIPVGVAPIGVAITPNGTKAYVANATGDRLSDPVSVIDTGTNTVIATVYVEEQPTGVAITPDGTRAYVTNFFSNTVSVIDTSTNSVVATVSVGPFPQGIAITPDGTRAYVADNNPGAVSVIDTSTNTLVATFPAGVTLEDVAIKPDGTRAYVTDGIGRVLVIDTSTNSVVATIPVGAVAEGIAITPDGTGAYVANVGSNNVSVIDTSANSVVATIPVGVNPVGVAITPLPQQRGSINSNFNGTAIAGGNVIWFTSVLSVQGLGSSPVKVSLTGSTIQFVAGGTPYILGTPNATITFSPTATSATTTFDAGTNTWLTTVPSGGLAGNIFLDGLAFPVPVAGLPGGIKDVIWQASFSSATPGISLNWKWAAAVYTSFGTDYNADGAKPVDDNKASVYKNSDHAGTPENFKSFVIGGATGGGGSNFTGGYSGTQTLHF